MFCKEYIIDLNGTQAAIRAGYSKKTAFVIATEILRKPYIKQYIAELQKPRFDRLEISAEKVLDEMRKLAFSNMMDYVSITPDGEAYVDLSKLTREQAASIGELSSDHSSVLDEEDEDGNKIRVRRTKIKLIDKKGVLEMLAKYHNLFAENNKVEVIVKQMGKIELDSGEELDLALT
jgi:phage terminase small subunit